ncbi:hypothetical protein DMA15_03435 [Streptomyces sp. WAC 01529]|uniref:LexA family protein n=1 Tax=Streptomyces sp. WAC 01529 TaxID=2203205 RepID=UPI000F7017E9|nr:hypothetical protein [Streptomyces sp. WAC 01529]AZM51746.1 hypothetical protein DMA15_03435 [Streptomyces sp. WAC 01529]
MIDHLTERQEQIVRCIREWVAERGDYPSLSEIGGCVGLSSKSAVHYQLHRLEARGVVVREAGQPYRLAW